MKITTIGLIIFSLLTCKNSHEAMSTKVQNEESITGNYSIQTIQGETHTIEDLTLTFDDTEKSVYGYSGCNRFTGSYSIIDGVLKIGPLASTRMACEPERNAIETKILQALSDTNSFSFENGTLTLLKDGQSILTAIKIKSEMVVTYKAATRGFFEIVVVSEDSLMTSKDYNLKIKQLVSTPELAWHDLKNEINKINLNTLNNLEPPSKTNNYDAAAAATLQISLNNTTYKTPIFDHGNPPKSIESIVNKVLSMKKLVEKQ